jgi:uncharacterized damage-inducible protein DinB
VETASEVFPARSPDAARRHHAWLADQDDVGYKFQKTESLLEQFDQHVAEARKAIKASKAADYDQPWSLKMGDKVLMTLPRGVVMRQHINHLCHHRGQLTVYLRLLDVPIPSIYGPTADEKWG